MIYLQIYLLISLFLTFHTAYKLKDIFGSLEYVIQTLRKMDKNFPDHFKGATDTQLVRVFLVVGFIASPIIAMQILMER